MTDYEKYNNAFISVFGVEEEKLAGLEYKGVASWDSVGHMQLIAELEDTFDIMIDTEDIIDFTGYKKGKEILKKYKIVIQ